MSDRSDKAVKLMAGHFNCAQSVFGAFCDDEGLSMASAAAIASGFGGGIALGGEVCGAVTGAVMVLGLRHGKGADTDPEKKQQTYAAVRQFFDAFREKYGSLVCRDLLGLDLSVPEDYQRAKDEELFKKICPKFVEYAAELLDK